jgi:antitoxin ParD1/3/4
MHISLTPHLQQYVESKVSGGLYNNASEVVRDALRRMVEVDEKSALDPLRQELLYGLESLIRGEGKPYHLADILQKVKEKQSKNTIVKSSVVS